MAKIPFILIAIGIGLLLCVFWLHAPILAFHITAACGCYFFFITCVVLNIGIQMGRRWPYALAVSSCEAGIVFALGTMLTGAWWGYHAWGAAWVWEPRITGLFLTTLFFVSWRIAVAIMGEEAMDNKKMTASLIVLGIPAMAFTHLAVKLMGGIHPSQIMPAHAVGMTALHVILAIIGQICIGVGIVWGRARSIQKKHAYDGRRPS